MLSCCWLTPSPPTRVFLSCPQDVFERGIDNAPGGRKKSAPKQANRRTSLADLIQKRQKAQVRGKQGGSNRRRAARFASVCILGCNPSNLEFT